MSLTAARVHGLDPHLILASPLSSLKLALIAALSFCTTARSSAMVFEARTLRMNCFTRVNQQVAWRFARIAYRSS